MPSACRRPWGDWRRALERGWEGETRRPSVQRLGDRGGKLVKKERAPRHVNAPIDGASRAGGPRTGVPVSKGCSTDGWEGETIAGGTQCRFRLCVLCGI